MQELYKEIIFTFPFFFVLLYSAICSALYSVHFYYAMFWSVFLLYVCLEKLLVNTFRPEIFVITIHHHLHNMLSDIIIYNWSLLAMIDAVTYY
jgi:hypothetical protein